MAAYGWKQAVRSSRGAMMVCVAAAIAWLSVAEVQAGPIRRMYRRAARSAAYRVAPSNSSNYAPGATYAGPAYAAPNVARYMGPYPPVGSLGLGYPPPPYVWFSGVLRPGFEPPWGGPFPGPAYARPPAVGNPPPAIEPPEDRLPAARVGEEGPLSDQAYVSGLYRDLLGREPDEPGLTAWVQALRRGMSRRAVANYLLNSRERAGLRRPPAPAADSAEAGVNRDTDRALSDLVEEPIPPGIPGSEDSEPQAVPPVEQIPAEDRSPTEDSGQPAEPEVEPEEVPQPPAVVPPKRGREF